MPKALTLSGSTRAGSYNVMLAQAMAGLFDAHGCTADYVDLKQFDLPLYDEDLLDAGIPAPVNALADRLDTADIIFIASPEYNASVTPRLKNAIDWLSRKDPGLFTRAVFGLGSASSGKLSGVVGLSHLRDILAKLHATTAPTALGVGPYPASVDAEGRFIEPAVLARAERLIDQLKRLSAL